MSNILIIKHGSLGDLIQANGAIKDIKNFYPNGVLKMKMSVRDNEFSGFLKQYYNNGNIMNE